MPYRTVPLVNDNFYHLFNRGIEKRNIFINDKDRYRFLKTLLYYQYQGPKPRLSKFNPLIHKHLSTTRIIDIIAFCLMPNHFHLLIRQLKEGGAQEFAHRLSLSYTKYFNTKYKRVGPLFQGEFKAVLVESDEQLIHLSRYIHLNPFASGLVTKLENYPWSSYPEYLDHPKRHPRDVQIVQKDKVLEFFPSAKGYEEFVLDQADYALSLELIKHQTLEEE